MWGLKLPWSPNSLSTLGVEQWGRQWFVLQDTPLLCQMTLCSACLLSGSGWHIGKQTPVCHELTTKIIKCHYMKNLIHFVRKTLYIFRKNCSPLVYSYLTFLWKQWINSGILKYTNCFLTSGSDFCEKLSYEGCKTKQYCHQGAEFL